MAWFRVHWDLNQTTTSCLVFSKLCTFMFFCWLRPHAPPTDVPFTMMSNHFSLWKEGADQGTRREPEGHKTTSPRCLHPAYRRTFVLVPVKIKVWVSTETSTLTCKPTRQQSASGCRCPSPVWSGNIYCPWAGWWWTPEREKKVKQSDRKWCICRPWCTDAKQPIKYWRVSHKNWWYSTRECLDLLVFLLYFILLSAISK